VDETVALISAAKKSIDFGINVLCVTSKGKIAEFRAFKALKCD